MAPTITLTATPLDPAWVAGRAFRVRVTVTAHGASAVEVARPDEPSRALAFAVVARGVDPSPDDWRDGAAYMTLAGAHGHPGVEVPVALAAGASIEAVWSLDAFVAPPPRGAWAVHVRVAARDGAHALAAPFDVAVIDADFVAAASARVSSSGRWLVHACADATSITVRTAPWAAPSGVTQHHAPCPWSGGRVAVAAHAFSPLDDPPLAAFRHTIAWCDGTALGVVRIAYDGTIEARAAVAHGLGNPSLLTPVQFEDGSAAVPLHEARDGAQRIVWVRVEATGTASMLAVHDLPGDARAIGVCATPRGEVRVQWIDGTGRRVVSQAPPWHSAFAAPVAFAAFDHPVEHFEAHDPRDASVILAVCAEAHAPPARTLHAYQSRDGAVEALGAVYDDRSGGGAVRAVLTAQGPAVLAVRDPAGAVWSAPVGAAWTRIEGVAASLAWGLTAGPHAVTVWGVDAREGLRTALR